MYLFLITLAAVNIILPLSSVVTKTDILADSVVTMVIFVFFERISADWIKICQIYINSTNWTVYSVLLDVL